jgi:AcrR family transcriptional regulator
MPKIVDHDSQRRELAEAAYRVIARGGLEGATVRLVAEEARCSTGPLAHYFGGKADLLVHALRHATAKTAARMIEHRQSARGVEGLRCVLREALPLDSERRAEWRVWLAFWGGAATDRALAREQSRRYADWRALVVALLREAEQDGEIQPGLDLTHEASVLLALIDGLGIQAMFERERRGASWQEAVIDRQIAMLVRGNEGAVAAGKKSGRVGAG